MDLFEKKALEEIMRAFREWEKKRKAEFKNERKIFITELGIPIKRAYTPLDLVEKGFGYMKDLGRSM